MKHQLFDTNVHIATGGRTFNNDGEIILLSSAKDIQETEKDFRFLRQLMNLGGCEASAFLPNG